MSRRRSRSRSLARYNGLSSDYTIAAVVAGVAGLGVVLWATGAFNAAANVYLTATRTPEDIIDAAELISVDPSVQPGYAGQPDWCNRFLYLVLDKLGVTIPFGQYGVRANDQIAWIAAGNDGWYPTDAAGAQQAALAGNIGIATYTNPVPGASGHVALVLPFDGSPIQIAQAGGTVSAQMPITSGFNLIPPVFFAHA